MAMATFISMLRGINVSGQKKVRMADLKTLYESLGLVNVKTYVQSGNVVFDSKEQDVAKLKESIQKQIEKTFGFSVPVLLRTGEDFQRLIGSRHFRKEKSENPSKVMVTFLYDDPEQSKLIGFDVPENEPCEFVITDQEIFLFCPDGYGKSKLSNNFFEKKLGITATTRNWKTVNALHIIASEREFNSKL